METNSLLDELKKFVRERRWIKNRQRTNIGQSQKVNGWNSLVEPVYSNTETSGVILELCQQLLGVPINCVCLNRNVHCEPHRDGKNQSESYFLMFGDFEGGALLIQEPNGIRRIEEKDTWFTFNGKRDLHWNEKILNGTKYSIICFVRDNIKKHLFQRTETNIKILFGILVLQ